MAELRTYHRMSGLQSHLAVLADCERALGRPERAIDLFRGADRSTLDQAVAVELLIVAAGARGDLGQKDAAVAMLQVPELTGDAAEPWTARLRYAYADALLAVGRREEAREWFSRAAEIDTDGETDAAERLLELDGVVIEGDEDDEDEEFAAGPGSPGAVPARPDADLASGDGDEDQLDGDEERLDGDDELHSGDDDRSGAVDGDGDRPSAVDDTDDDDDGDGDDDRLSDRDADDAERGTDSRTVDSDAGVEARPDADAGDLGDDLAEEELTDAEAKRLAGELDEAEDAGEPGTDRR